MPRLLLWSLRVLSATWVVALALQAICPSAAQAADRDRHVIVVSLDGLAAYLVDDPKAALPTIRRLAREGSIVEGGMKVSNPSVTWPNQA